MRFLILIIITVIISASLVDGRPPSIHDGAWIANNDTTPLLSREYQLLVFPVEFDYLEGYPSLVNSITGIAETSPLQCYDGTDVECAENLHPIKIIHEVPPAKKALEIITQLM